MISLAAYAELFRVPGLAASVLASIPGRLPIGMATLAILIFVQMRTGSFALAGSTAAFAVLGLAAVAPPLGRLIDRIGPRPVLAMAALVHPAMLAALAVLVFSGATHGWIALAAFLAGASFPPITICMRALYPRLLADLALLRTAYSMDAALIEVIFIAGPILVALFVAAEQPLGAVLFAAGCAAAGSFVFLRSPAVRQWRPAAAGSKHRLGPLGEPALVALFASTVLYSIAFGLYEVAVTAFAAARGAPAAAGVILALASVGTTAAALLFGARSWRPPVARQFLIAVALMAAGLLAIAPIGDLVLFAAANIVACAPMAVVLATHSLLLSRLAPQSMLFEAFTWGATCLLGGVSAGIAAGGVLAEHIAPAGILLAAAASTLLAGAVVWAALGAARNAAG